MRAYSIGLLSILFAGAAGCGDSDGSKLDGLNTDVEDDNGRV